MGFRQDMKKIAVVKFGGTSIANEQVRASAIMRIRELRRADFAVAAIVSAMGRAGAPYATDTLLSLVRGDDTRPETRDMLMSCGETISACVFADALCKEGIPAIPMNGTSARMQTTNEHLNAEMIGMDTAPVLSVLNGGGVAVITGFQGVSSQGEITTLGRGGSDTSAVFVAGCLAADKAIIYTDVQGVAQCDPRIVHEANFLDEIDYDDMLLLARLGAGVVHPRSIETAKRFNIPIWVRSTFTEGAGTKICRSSQNKNDFIGIAIRHDEAQDAVSIVHREAPSILENVQALFPNRPVALNKGFITVLLSRADAPAAAKRLYEAFALPDCQQ